MDAPGDVPAAAASAAGEEASLVAAVTLRTTVSLRWQKLDSVGGNQELQGKLYILNVCRSVWAAEVQSFLPLMGVESFLGCNIGDTGYHKTEADARPRRFNHQKMT